MIELIDLERHHLRLIRPQDAQVAEVTADSLAGPIGKGWTAVADGVPICCGGVMPVWEGRGYCWTLIDRDAGPHMLGLTRAIRSLLDRSGWRRLEMAVDAEFEAGARWAVLLGFRLECHAPKYLPNGRDALVYVRL